MTEKPCLELKALRILFTALSDVTQIDGYGQVLLLADKEKQKQLVSAIYFVRECQEKAKNET